MLAGIGPSFIDRHAVWRNIRETLRPFAVKQHSADVHQPKTIYCNDPRCVRNRKNGFSRESQLDQHNTTFHSQRDEAVPKEVTTTTSDGQKWAKNNSCHRSREDRDSKLWNEYQELITSIFNDVPDQGIRSRLEKKGFHSSLKKLKVKLREWGLRRCAVVISSQEWKIRRTFITKQFESGKSKKAIHQSLKQTKTSIRITAS